MRRRDENKVAALEASALAIVQNQGLSQLSISKLAKQAGVSVATAYIYYENKADLLGKLYQRVQERLIFAVPSPAANQPIQAQFNQVMQAYAHNFLAHPADVTFLAAMTANPEYFPAREERGDSLLGPAMMAVIKAAYQADGLQTGNVDLLLAQGLYPLEWLLESRLQHGLSVQQDEIDTLIKMAERAIFRPSMLADERI